MRIAAAMSNSVSPPPAAAPRAERSDRQLLAALAAGDRSAADALVNRTYRQTWAALFRLTGGDAELAADLTQDTYRKAWAALPSFDGRARFSTWLYRIAYTTFLNHVRRPRRVVPMEEGVAERAQYQGDSPEKEADRSQQGDRLRRAVIDLPDPLRQTVTARFWGEVPVRELAAADGISEVAVRKRLRKALSILRQTMEVAS
jgi:RNA polymerase sigma-70 factor (ECF subfamily)